jgi:hypothetical protein
MWPMKHNSSKDNNKNPHHHMAKSCLPGTYTYHLMYRLFPKLGPHSHSLCLQIHPCLGCTCIKEHWHWFIRAIIRCGWWGSQDCGRSWSLTIAPQGGKWGWCRNVDYHGNTLNRQYGYECMTQWQCLHKNSKYGIAKSWWHFLPE